jgi:hypothetical protein
MRVWLLALVVFLAASGTALAQSSTRSTDWQRFDADIVVQPDGSLAVTETQTIDFQGTFQQGFRVIPLDRTTGITDVSVAEVNAAGQEVPLAVTTSTDSNGLRLDWTFAPVTNDSRTFVLRYLAHGATRVYPGGDQVDWNAVYADRPGGVGASTVTLHLPADVAPDSVVSAVYVLPPGRLPQQVGTATTVDARTLRFDIGGLPAGSGAEIRAQVPSGVLPLVSAPPWQAAADRADWIQQSVAPIANFLILLLTMAIAVGGGLGVILLWYQRVREPPIPAVPPRLDQPPSDLPAPLAGTLVDGAASTRDAVAILLDLARRGVLSLKQEAGPSGSDVRVVLHRPSQDPTLQRYERVLLVALFGQGVDDGEILLSQARTRFSSAVPILEQRLYEATVDAGLFPVSPVLERRRFLRLGLLGVGVGLVLAILPMALFGAILPAAWLPGAALVAIGLAVVWLSRKMPHRTPRGALEAARWRAYRAYLLDQPSDSRADGVNDADLAYAVALGADREFLKRLEGGGGPPPAWYAPRGSPGPIIFVPGGWHGGTGGGGHAGRSAPLPGGVAGSSGPQSWSDALADLLNAAAGALSHGGGSGPWSGGGWGGGGGGGGGSGGFN